MSSNSETKKTALLELCNAKVHYGGVRALDGASISVDEGEIVALLGPNGAGKSTALKAVFGLAPLDSGELFWRGERVLPKAHEMAMRGASFVPQGRRVFPDLSIEENLEVGGWHVKSKAERARRIGEVLEIFPVLARKRRKKSGALSGGEQQMLALARGLMTEPRLLLLDEPSLGLSPKIVKEVFQKIKEINESRRTAVLVVEHNLKSLLDIVHRAYIFNRGAVAAASDAESLAKSDILERMVSGKL